MHFQANVGQPRQHLPKAYRWNITRTLLYGKTPHPLPLTSPVQMIPVYDRMAPMWNTKPNHKPADRKLDNKPIDLSRELEMKEGRNGRSSQFVKKEE